MLVVHGLDLSYFTGKLEGYLRAKGLPYRLVEMSVGSFRRLAWHTGVQQMPQLEMPDGRWMTDTVRIIDALETEWPGPTLTPADPACSFMAGLIETFADEHLWRPALYYRWAFADDARLMSARLARGMLRDVPCPTTLKRLPILWRQRAHYLRGEGVTSENRAAIEADYIDLLDALEPVLSRRDWLMGEAPTRADIGLFGPMFRHFHCDPTPGRIMRARAPSVAAWVTRLWALNGTGGVDAWSVTSIPDDLDGVIGLIVERFLPELAANATACAAGADHVRYRLGNHDIRYSTNPYRVGRLSRLQQAFSALSPSAGRTLTDLLGAAAVQLLSGPVIPEFAPPPGLRDRQGRPIR